MLSEPLLLQIASRSGINQEWAHNWCSVDIARDEFIDFVSFKPAKGGQDDTWSCKNLASAKLIFWKYY